MINEKYGFGTKVIHAGNVKDTQYGALATPIFQTSTFVFDNCEQGGRRFAGEESGYIYTRLGHPTTCVAAASGMGAISSALWTVAAAGKHIIADGTLYGCTFALLNHGMTRYGVEVWKMGVVSAPYWASLTLPAWMAFVPKPQFSCSMVVPP